MSGQPKIRRVLLPDDDIKEVAIALLEKRAKASKGLNVQECIDRLKENWKKEK